MAEPIAVYEGPELIGSTTFSLNPGSGATVSYSGDWNDGDLLVIISESPRTTPLNPVPSGFSLLFQSDIGTIGGADACRTIVYGGYKSGASVGVTAAASNDHSVYLMLCFRGTHAKLIFLLIGPKSFHRLVKDEGRNTAISFLFIRHRDSDNSTGLTLRHT